MIQATQAWLWYIRMLMVKIYNIKTNYSISDLFKDDFLTLIWDKNEKNNV